MSELGGGRAIQDRFIFAQDVEPDRKREPTLWIDTSDPARTAYSYSAATDQFERLTVNDFEQIENRQYSLLSGRVTELSDLANRDYSLLTNVPTQTDTASIQGGLFTVFNTVENTDRQAVDLYLDGVEVDFINNTDRERGVEAEGFDLGGNTVFYESRTLDEFESVTITTNFDVEYIEEIFGRSTSSSDVRTRVRGNVVTLPEHSHGV